MNRFGYLLAITLAALLGIGDMPAWAKGGRGGGHHTHRAHHQRAHHHHKRKVHPKNPTRRPKHHPKKHHVKHHPRPKPHRPHPKPKAPPRSIGKPKAPPTVQKPNTPAKKPEPKRETRRFVNYNLGEYTFDDRWWYNFVVYPTMVSRNEAFTANYNTIVPPPNTVVIPPRVKAKDGLPMSPAGSSLAVQLDRMDVEHHWLPGQRVDWRTGNAMESGQPSPASNAGGFVAAVCAQFKLPMPSPAGDNLLPGRQYDWLVSDGLKKGWIEVGALEAQLLANQGWVVIAAWKDAGAGGDQSLTGQTAIVRPTRKPAAEITPNGPRVVEAGVHNHNDISLKDGFPPKAWTSKQVVYLAHRPG
jgi:outer membrane biosynthesis protein TonB